MKALSIAQASMHTGLSTDTLRYYEKIGLIGPVPRTASGQRRYGERELSQLQFILRARSMQFSLEEIGQLLELRRQPLQARKEVRQLTRQKLEQIEQTLKTLHTLHDELSLLLKLCPGEGDGPCPIMEQMSYTDVEKTGKSP